MLKTVVKSTIVVLNDCLTIVVKYKVVSNGGYNNSSSDG